MKKYEEKAARVPATKTARTPAKAAKPSANAGRTGQYNVATSVGDYSYHVFVPSSYNDNNPAGIHLFFGPQGGCADNSDFGRWAKHFINPFNLIGINMKYPDGNNMTNTEGKVAAAREAIAQIVADYKIIVGRGAVSSFSGGGIPQGRLYQRMGENIDAGWPFLHHALYGSSYVDTRWGVPVGFNPGGATGSWLIGVGSEEWTLARLGLYAIRQMSAVLAGSPCRDNYLQIQKHGHAITDAEVEESARIFRRMDLAFAPLLYAPDYPESNLKPIMQKANHLALGPAAAGVEKVLAKAGCKPDQKTAEFLERALALVGERSQFGRMAAEFLALRE